MQPMANSAFANTLFDRFDGKPRQLLLTALGLLVCVQGVDTLLVWTLFDRVDLMNIRVQTLAVFFVILIVFVRSSEQDLARTQRNYPELSEVVSTTIAIEARTTKVVLILLGAIFPILVNLSGIVLVNPQATYSEAVSYYLGLIFLQGDKANGTVELYRTLISIGWGILWMYLVYFVFAVAQAFDHYAKQVPLYLFSNSALTPFARPSMRGLLLVAALFSMLVYSIAMGISKLLVLNVFLPICIFFAALFIVSAKPLLTLRNRIQTLKKDELICLDKVIAGDKNALADSRLYRELQQATFVDLLNYRDKVHAIWVWPLQAHIRRIGLYVILPPVTWVLSAIVARLIG